MWRYRKMHKIKWTERITNETTLTGIKENCGVILKYEGTKRQDTYYAMIVKRKVLQRVTYKIIMEEEDQGWNTRNKS